MHEGLGSPFSSALGSALGSALDLTLGAALDDALGLALGDVLLCEIAGKFVVSASGHSVELPLGRLAEGGHHQVEVYHTMLFVDPGESAHGGFERRPSVGFVPMRGGGENRELGGSAPFVWGCDHRDASGADDARRPSVSGADVDLFGGPLGEGVGRIERFAATLEAKH